MTDFRETKIEILSEEHSRAFQEAVIAAGGRWHSEGVVKHLFAEFLFVDVDLNLGFEVSDRDYFDCHQYKEIQFPLPTKGHPYAELMARYAEDAKSHAEPWELWEYKGGDGAWIDCHYSPAWATHLEYRRKPKTKLIHGVEIPDIGLDLSKCEGRTDFYVPCVRSHKYYAGLAHHAHNNCIRYSQTGIAYPLTDEGRQAAILHAKAMLNIK